MLGPVHHVAYLARDIDASTEELEAALGASITREFELPQFDLAGRFLARPGMPPVEVFTYTDPSLLDERCGEARLRLDHVAHEVEDLESTAAAMRSAGVRFGGADLRSEASAPFQLGNALHLWSLPDGDAGLALQLVQHLREPVGTW